MKNVFPISFCFYLLTGCNTTQKDDHYDLNLYFESSVSIDSIFISNITQDREFQFVSYSNPLRINLNDSINDLYNINFYTENGLLMNQMWLDGENIVIKGSVSEKVKIDTVLGSDLYYKAVEFKSNYRDLIDNHSDDSTKINSFLFSELDRNIENPLSIDIGEALRLRNLNNRNNLSKVFELLSGQSSNLKNHLLHPYRKIEHMLASNKVDLSQHMFYNTEAKQSRIDLTNEKAYLIDFWFVNCPPCIKDHKLVKTRLEWLSDHNVELIGISTDTNHEKWIDYLNKNEYEWLNYREQDDYNQRVTTQLLITTFPTYLLLDKNGFVLRRSNSFADIEGYITK